MTRSASADETPVFAATAARRSAFVIAISLLSRNRSSVTINLNGWADKMQVPRRARRHDRNPRVAPRERCRQCRCAVPTEPKTSDKDETIRDFRILRFDVTNFVKLHVFGFRRANLLRDVHGRTRMMHYVRSLRRGVVRSVQKNFWNLSKIHREITKQSTTRRRSATMLVNVVASITSTPRRC